MWQGRLEIVKLEPKSSNLQIILSLVFVRKDVEKGLHNVMILVQYS